MFGKTVTSINCADLCTLSLILKIVLCTRGKVKLVQLPCEQFLQAFEIYRALLRAKQLGEKRAKIKNPVKNAVVQIFLSL